jgi:Uma2 family endonuclease
MTQVEALNIVRPLPLTVDDFFLLDEHGAFEGYGKTELIEGEIYFMNAQHRPHLMAKMDLHHLFHAALADLKSNYRSVTEGTVKAGLHNAPEPDIVLTSEPYGEGPIPIASVGLIVEISDTTQKHDLGIKCQAYAKVAVPEYWVFDIKAGVVHQMWAPEEESYGESRKILAGEMITSETINGLTIRLPA